MTYTVRSSEKLRKPAAVMETKALLYLMNFCSDSDEVHYFIVDFFNDLTGMDRTSSKLWDIQSKGASTSSPKEIGKELVTLYKNFISSFTFHNYILFLGGVTSSLRIDDTKNVFDVNNVKPGAKEKLIEGLREECNAKTYIDNDKIIDEILNEFIDNVIFVVDDKEPSEYVKGIMELT